MRPARLSLASFVLTTIPLVACTLDNSPSSSCDQYGDSSACYNDYPYGGGASSGDYGSDSGTSTGDVPSSDCENAFAVTFDAPVSAGDCQLVVEPYDSAYDKAVYFFGAPPSGDSEPCEALEGPLPGRCFRALGTIAFGSTSGDDIVALQDALGISTSFTATLACAHDTEASSKDVSITCVPTPKKDAGPVVDDDAGTSFGDASVDDASPSADAGCGP